MFKMLEFIAAIHCSPRRASACPVRKDTVVTTATPDIALDFCLFVNTTIKVIFKQKPSKKVLIFTRKGRDHMVLLLQA